MHLRVAVGARSIKDKTRGGSERLGWMSRFDVALLAQPGHLDLQQVRVDRAMGLVTVQAVFQDRWMFPQKGAARLSMTLVAIFIDRVLDQQRRGDRAMGVVTVRAGHFPLPQGHVRGAQKLGPFLEVTREAEL